MAHTCLAGVRRTLGKASEISADRPKTSESLWDRPKFRKISSRLARGAHRQSPRAPISCPGSPKKLQGFRRIPQGWPTHAQQRCAGLPGKLRKLRLVLLLVCLESEGEAGRQAGMQVDKPEQGNASPTGSAGARDKQAMRLTKSAWRCACERYARRKITHIVSQDFLRPKRFFIKKTTLSMYTLQEKR